MGEAVVELALYSVIIAWFLERSGGGVWLAIAIHAGAHLDNVNRAPDEEVIVTQSWDELRRLMWNYVGIVRTTKRLLRARRRVDSLLVEINHDYWEYDVTSDFLELRNIATVARLVVESALRRHESRGIHYTLDYPGADDEAAPSNTVLDRLVLEGAHWLRG